MKALCIQNDDPKGTTAPLGIPKENLVHPEQYNLICVLDYVFMTPPNKDPSILTPDKICESVKMNERSPIHG